MKWIIIKKYRSAKLYWHGNGWSNDRADAKKYYRPIDVAKANNKAGGTVVMFKDGRN